MTVNPGLVPIDTTSKIGQTRALIGDTQSVPLNPVVAGQGSYGKFSDAEISTFLLAGGNNILMATGFAYLQLAAAASLKVGTRSIKTDDLVLGVSVTAGELRQIADEWFLRANNVESFTLSGPGPTSIDFREFLYPSGVLILSDLFWAVELNEY